MDAFKRVSTAGLEQLSAQARRNPRLRANFNLHTKLDDPVQRFFNAMEPGTYVRPHRHTEDDKWELFLLVRGQAMVVLFDDAGAITERVVLSPDDNLLVEIPDNTWHTVVALERDTILYESKRGPYIVLSDKDFAVWAPQEGEQGVVKILDWYANGEIGSRFIL